MTFQSRCCHGNLSEVPAGLGARIETIQEQARAGNARVEKMRWSVMVSASRIWSRQLMMRTRTVGLCLFELKLVKVVTLQLVSAPNWMGDVETTNVDDAGGSSSLDAILLRERSRRPVHRTSQSRMIYTLCRMYGDGRPACDSEDLQCPTAPGEYARQGSTRLLLQRRSISNYASNEAVRVRWLGSVG